MLKKKVEEMILKNENLSFRKKESTELPHIQLCLYQAKLLFI